ncbi:MAG: hypothetical protein ABDH37_07830 [Candidatus Hydrothermales bacterium]
MQYTGFTRNSDVKGISCFHYVFKENMQVKPTLENALKDSNKRFGIEKVIFVAVKGITFILVMNTF